MGRGGVVRWAPLLGWRDVDLADLVREALPVPMPVMVENDANALAIGATYGRRIAQTGVTLVLNMETGVGGGILIDGHLFRGANGLAGEIGHLRLGLDGSEGQGSLEERLGFEALLSDHGRRRGTLQPRFADFLGDVRDREPTAVAVAEGWARTLAFALVQACRVIDPDTVVLGGSVASLYPLVETRVREHMGALQEPGFPRPAIKVHEDADFGAAYGAACMLHQRFLSLESQRFADGMPDAPPPAGPGQRPGTDG
jgi:predicted NBD/HSP70 family sugar kinase